MGSALVFTGTAKTIGGSLAKGALGKVVPILSVAESVVTVIGSAYGLYSEKEKTRNLRMQYEMSIDALDVKIREEKKRFELEKEKRLAEMFKNLNILKQELETSIKELEIDLKERGLELAREVEKERLKDRVFKDILDTLRRSIVETKKILDEKPDFINADLEEEIRDVIFKYTEMSKQFI